MPVWARVRSVWLFSVTLLGDKRFDGMPLILETPDESRWAAEIRTLRELAETR